MCTYGLALKDGAKVYRGRRTRFGFVLFLSCFDTDYTLFPYCFGGCKLRTEQKTWNPISTKSSDDGIKKAAHRRRNICYLQKTIPKEFYILSTASSIFEAINNVCSLSISLSRFALDFKRLDIFFKDSLSFFISVEIVPFIPAPLR